MHESYLVYRKKRFLWLSLLMTAFVIAVYWIDDPQEPANGGTLLV